MKQTVNNVGLRGRLFVGENEFGLQDEGKGGEQGDEQCYKDRQETGLLSGKVRRWALLDRKKGKLQDVG